MKIYLGQINPTIGALTANAEMIRRAYDDGVAAGAEVVLVPELAVTGYPPRDLLDREVFVGAALEVRDALVSMTGNVALIFGCLTRNESWCGKPARRSSTSTRSAATTSCSSTDRRSSSTPRDELSTARRRSKNISPRSPFRENRAIRCCRSARRKKSARL